MRRVPTFGWISIALFWRPRSGPGQDAGGRDGQQGAGAVCSPPSRFPLPPLEHTVLRLDDVQAVIESAKARGDDSLARFIRKRLPEATDAEVADATDLAVEIIESIPLFLARAAQEARDRHLQSAVQPLLEYATRYFLRPMDLIPEMTQGLAGLLDDTYLVLRILENLDRGPEPFLDWDLEHPLTFLRRLVGERVGGQLDDMSVKAMADLSDHLSVLWRSMVQQA